MTPRDVPQWPADRADGSADLRVQIRRAWAVLSAPETSQLSSFTVRPTALAGGPACRVALDRSGVRHLLVPTEAAPGVPDPRPSVLSCVVRPLSFDKIVTRHVDISCSDPGLHEEFDEVIVDLLDTVADVPDPGSVALSGLQRWRRLFRNRLIRGLSPSARAGLFAELIVLATLLEQRPELPLSCWTGPQAAPHDFEAPQSCLEVKAIGAEPDTIVIHGIEQLDRHADRPLELLVLTVVPDPEGTTLSELVERTRGLTHDVAEFDERVQRAGWRADMSQTDVEPMSFSGLLRVPVRDGVPRLVASDLTGRGLPPHVTALTYRIDHDALLAHAATGSLRDVTRGALGEPAA